MMDQCPECSGFGTIALARDTGVIGTGYLYEERCLECDGAGEVESLCLCCDEPLDEHGWCASCEDIGLTETIGDPFKRRAA